MTEQAQQNLPLDTDKGNSPPAADAASAASTSSQTAQPTAVARPDWLDESAWDAEKNSVKLDALQERFTKLSAFEKAEADRAAALPEKADDYGFLPDDYKPPEGVQIDKDAPVWNLAREFAKENGWTKEQFAKNADFFIRAQAESFKAQQNLITEAMKARDAALGENGAARIDGVLKGFEAIAGGDDAAKQLVGTQLKYWLNTPEQVVFAEKLLKALSDQGVTSFSASGRGGGDGEKLPDGYETMTFEQKWNAMVQNRGRAA